MNMEPVDLFVVGGGENGVATEGTCATATRRF